MARLTNDLKDQIVTAAVNKSGILEEKAALQKEFALWAEDARVYSLGGKEVANALEEAKNTISAIVAQFPKNVVNTTDVFRYRQNIFTRINGERHKIYFDGDRSYSDDAPSRPTPDPVTVLPGSDLHKAFERLRIAEDDLQKREAEIRRSVRAILNSCTTTKKLVSLWPECEELLPKSQEVFVTLPAVSIDVVNKLLGIAK